MRAEAGRMHLPATEHHGLPESSRRQETGRNRPSQPSEGPLPAEGLVSDLQPLKRRHFCCGSHLVCRTLLCEPEKQTPHRWDV